MAERTFPIQKSLPVPWSVAERAYRVYAHFHGTSQSLERLAERGGFGLEELGSLLDGGNGNPDRGRLLTEAQMRAFGLVDLASWQAKAVALLRLPWNMSQERDGPVLKAYRADEIDALLAAAPRREEGK